MQYKIKLKRNCDKRIKSGHLWIFNNELENIPSYPPGSIVEVFDSKNNSYGSAFFNPGSLISARLLKTKEIIDTSFFINRINEALELRKRIYPETSTYRLVYGESDYLPGLIIDRFDNYLTLQIYSYGMELKKQEIIEALLKCIPEIKGIIEKSNSTHRIYEGLEIKEEILYGHIPDKIDIIENSIKFNISLEKSQKSGWYLDQKLNRQFISNISKDKIVLDVFTNQGGFALNAAKGGAKFTYGIDSSSLAIEYAKNNAKVNNFNNVEFYEADAIQFLKNSIAEGKKYDLIILDPPPYAKNKKNIESAKIGYTNLNKLALKLLAKNGGILATSSCSGLITDDVFYEIIKKVAFKENVNLKLIYQGKQAPDHPILPSMDETKYLKFFVFAVS